jgi:hypothetical protein
MTLKDKILFFLEREGIKKTDFFDKTGIAASNFKGVGLSSELGGDKLVKILSIYPRLSPDWLLIGKGPMLREEESGSRSTDDSQWYKLYKEMEAKADRLLEENGALKNEIRRLESGESTEKFVPDVSTRRLSVSQTDAGSVNVRSKRNE